MYRSGIKQIELELTSKCNAACPQCARNFHGGKTWPSLPLVNWDFETLKRSFAEPMQTLEHLRLCGTYGEPCIYPQFLEFIEWVIANSDCKITINTNGGIRSKAWWRSLGALLGTRGKVYFGIDGLEDTHHLHRRNTRYDRVISHADEFIKGGGRAVWSFLVFKHNQHQVEQARALSEQMGFDSFAVKSTSRFVDKSHRLVDRTPVYNRKNELEYYLEPTDDERYANNGYKEYIGLINDNGGRREAIQNIKIDCIAVKYSGVSVSSEGYVFPCGFLLDRLYGHEAEKHPDHKKMKQMIESSTDGYDSINLQKNSLETIVAGELFQKIKNSWSDKSLERCAQQCGVGSTLLKNANTDLAKTWPSYWPKNWINIKEKS